MRLIIYTILFALLIPISAQSQLFRKHKKAEYDTLRNGRYYEYWDKENTILSAKGHFSQDSPCKTWKYYHKDGTRRMKVKYRDQLKIKYYTDSGRLDQKGHAVLDLDAKYIHYYWIGPWRFYDSKRKLYRIALFENGNEVKVLYGPEDPIYEE
jgi:antitoxin component YwqK of YwqJK toxin-antitoxin module